MVFAWDENKNRTNRRKHGVSFEMAALVFQDPQAVSYFDRLVHDEERWHTIGLIGGIEVLSGTLQVIREALDKPCQKNELRGVPGMT